MKEADPNDTCANGIKGPDGASHAGRMMVRNESLTEQGITMNALTGLVRPIVEDRTGLTGKYDVSLQWSRDEIADTGKEMTDASVKPSLFTALQDQLGLRLDATKGPEDTVVVDHVEVPSEN